MTMITLNPINRCVFFTFSTLTNRKLYTLYRALASAQTLAVFEFQVYFEFSSKFEFSYCSIRPVKRNDIFVLASTTLLYPRTLSSHYPLT